MPFFSIFVQLWMHFSPWRRPKLKKTTFKDKTTPLGYPNIAISRPYLVLIFQEKYNYFLSYFGHFLVKKGTWSHVKETKSKIDIAYFTNMIPGIESMQSVWPHHSQVLSFVESKNVFFKFQTTFSSLAAFLGTTPTF